MVRPGRSVGPLQACQAWVVGRRAAKLSVRNARTCGVAGVELEMRVIEDETDLIEVSVYRIDEIVDEDQMPEREREDFSVWTVGEARK